VKFAQPKEGALTWVCGMMVHAQAPKLDRAYDILDSLISVSAGEHVIGEFGYGHANKKSFDKFDDATLASKGLARDANVILSAGHFMIPQTAEWTAKVSNEFEQIKSGF
jgi:spermidine/putrescine transport system substrate-binding protein